MYAWRTYFLTLWVQKPGNKLNERKTKFALTCSFEKVIRTLAFRSREKIEQIRTLVRICPHFHTCWNFARHIATAGSVSTSKTLPEKLSAINRICRISQFHVNKEL